MEIEPGLKGESRLTVDKAYTAIEVGSGNVPVLATPIMVALMENAAINSIKRQLPPEMTTVGGHIDCKHLSPTPIGMQVTALAELIEVNKRKLLFKIEAYDEKEMIGEGKHQRVIVDYDKFINSSHGKLNSNK